LYHIQPNFVDDWDEVENYIFENRKWFAGISLLPVTGDKDYPQAPFTAVLNPEQIIEKYGDAALFASGLIVDGLNAFNNNLWKACDTVLGYGEKLDYREEEVIDEIAKTTPEELWSNLGFKNGTLSTLTSLKIKPEVEEYKRYMDSTLITTIHNYALKKDWIRRANQFAKRYFKSKKDMTYCLKDVYNYHKWVEVNRDIEKVKLEEFNSKPQYVDIDTTGAVACSGVQCEIEF
jgi:ribonucleoside-diphosphate reductase alpha chain